MKLEDFSDYIIPIVLLFFYFVLGNLNKKKKPPVDQIRKPQTPLPAQKKAQVHRKQVHIKQEKPKPLPIRPVQHMPNKSIIPTAKKSSRAMKLLKKNALRQAFLTREILNRPHE